MTFERTFDMDLVRSILTHPKIYPFIGDDDAPKVEDFKPREDPAIWCVIVRDGAEVIGLFLLVAQSRSCWDIHVNFLPCAWGRRAAKAGREIWAWIWANTECRRVVATVAICNRSAIAYAMRSGMKRFGVNVSSFLKHGELQDQVLLGISRP